MEKKTKRTGRLRELTAHLNIGMVLVIVVALYVVVSMVIMLTSRRAQTYQVRVGSLNENTIRQGLVLRDEQVVDSDHAGTVNYYNREGDRLAVGALACTVDEKGQISDYLKKSTSEDGLFSDEDLEKFRSDIVSFTESYSPRNFSVVYDFRSQEVSTAQKIYNTSVLTKIEGLDSSAIHRMNAEVTGEIVYSTDGYEDLTLDKVTLSDLKKSGYNRKALENGSRVKKGDPVYRIVTDENWSIVTLADSKEEAQAMEKQQYVKIRFLQNSEESWASVTTRELEDGSWLICLGLTNSVSEFCSERYLDIEIETDETQGLKVPQSAITRGSFFLIPQSYLVTGAGGQTGVLKQVYDKRSGKNTAEFVAAATYGEKTKDGETYCYVDNRLLKSGMVINRPNSTAQITLENPVKLVGCYYINEGYPVFRQVEIVQQNSEYAIVSPATAGGLQDYDYVVLHADSINMDN